MFSRRALRRRCLWLVVADQALTLFGSDILNKGDRYSWTPTPPGTIPYWCTIHPDMLGTIIVTR